MDSSKLQETRFFPGVNVNICNIPHFITENLRWVQHVRVDLARASQLFLRSALSGVTAFDNRLLKTW